MAATTHDKKPDLPKEHSNGDVEQQHGDAGVARVRMLLAHGHAHPSAVAEIIADYPQHKHQIMHWLHEHKGNAFVKEVEHAEKGANHAKSHDESLIKPNHQPGYTGSAPDTSKAPNDHNRIIDKGSTDGKPPTLAKETDVYRGDGTAFHKKSVAEGQAKEKGEATPTQLPEDTALVHVAAGATVKINAGAVKMLNVKTEDGKGFAVQKCVLAFGAGGVTGWIPVWALGDAHKSIVAQDDKLDHALEKEGGEEKYDKKKYRVVEPKFMSQDIANLRILPNQDPAGGANFCAHYCERPGGVVNLLDNVPGGGGERMGVAIDVVTRGAKFHAAKDVAHEHTPLWRSGDGGAQTSHKLTFIYGMIEVNGQKSFGWINEAMLGPVKG